MKTKVIYLSVVCVFLLILVLTPYNTTGEQEQTGSIYGITYQIIGWEVIPVPFAYIESENGHTISNLWGYYELSNLTFNHCYEIEASKLGYKSDSVLVELTDNNPSEEINFLLIFGDQTINDLFELSARQKSDILAKILDLNIHSRNARILL